MLHRVIVVSALAATIMPPAPAVVRAGTLEEQVQLCNACHGENGIPQDRATPIVWGQHQGYLYLQLRDYKRGDRKNDQMSPVAEALGRDEMMALAEYYSQKPWPDLRQAPAPEPVKAQAQRANVAVGCTGCHLGEYQGAGTQPRLAGQTKEYLARSMLDFRTRLRGNNPGMSDLMKAISEEEIMALADYLAGQ
jgi:cytochrome c553